MGGHRQTNTVRTDPNPDLHPHTDLNTNVYQYPESNRDEHGDTIANWYKHANLHSNPFGNGHRNTNTRHHANPYHHSYRDGGSHANIHIDPYCDTHSHGRNYF